MHQICLGLVQLLQSTGGLGPSIFGHCEGIGIGRVRRPTLGRAFAGAMMDFQTASK